MATDKPRFSVTFTDDTFHKIQKFQKDNGISTQSKAVARLVELAMNAIESENNTDGSPQLVIQKENELLKKYRLLDGYGKKAVDGVLDIEYQRCGEERKAKAIAEVKSSKERLEAAEAVPEVQKTPAPAAEDGLCDSEETLMRYVKKMNPGQQALFLEQWRRLLGQRKEPSAVQPPADDKVP